MKKLAFTQQKEKKEVKKLAPSVETSIIFMSDAKRIAGAEGI